jgi:hypothetical protein
MDGLVYWLCGMRHAERLVVSAYTARKFWTGAIAAVVTSDETQKCAEAIPGVQAIRVALTATKHSAYVGKTRLPDWVPFDRAIYLDADTIVVGPLDPLLESPLTITQFSKWQSLGQKIGGRIKWFQQIKESPRIQAMVDTQFTKSYPAINTGVFAWHKGGKWVAEWQAIADAGAPCVNYTDEIAMQILHPGIPGCRVVDDRWNCSPIYGVHKTNAAVWHFHGDKHLRNAEGKRLWEPAFQEAYTANVGGLREWAGRYDPWVRTLLANPGAYSHGEAVHS